MADEKIQNQIPCINCLTLPMCREHVKSYNNHKIPIIDRCSIIKELAEKYLKIFLDKEIEGGGNEYIQIIESIEDYLGC